MYIYNADTYCDSCAADIIAHLRAKSVPPDVDSDNWPQQHEPGESDYPDHCASNHECLEKIDLRGYGLPQFGTLYGAEDRYVGVLLNDDLTPDGWEFLKANLQNPDNYKTGYQIALHNYWRDEYNVEVSSEI